MKRLFRMRCPLALALVMVLSSCLNSDDDSIDTSYSDMAITSFTLGTLNRYQHNTSKTTGHDTIVKITYTGSLYPMTIDHIGQRIYNEKPLPIGTDAKHVICTVTAKNNGVVYLKRPTNDSLFYHQSTDSVDLSEPRIFRVYAINGSGSRDYTVTLNVSSTTGTSFAWVKTGTTDAGNALSDRQLIAFADTIRLVDRGIVVKEGEAFRLNDGLTECSKDLEQWAPKAGVTRSDEPLQTLVAASTHELLALTSDGRLMRSTDEGATWEDELADESWTLLPRENTAYVCWPYTPADNTDYVLMAGNNPLQETEMSLWRKLSPWEGKASWTYMPFDDTNRNPMPRLEGLSLACYDGTVLAMGLTDKTIYQSRDQGITWQKPSMFDLPVSLTGNAALMTVDIKDRLWLVTDTGEVWQGTKR